ncbi:MAG: nitroreductase family deazaflavin-dependent oxidoreductase [Acidimicrobiia bacterium]|nr:MAG: nitroreductase family deazaflavin-dependent oxidoreductase [Acidimicrobiia bacterium]
MRDTTVRLLSILHTYLYRMTAGRVGRRLVNNDMLLLTTTGRATGNKHTVPLLYLRDGNRLVVIASYGGRSHHPEWYRNLVANTKASVQILGEHREVEAGTMTESERSEWWPRVVAAYGDYAVYQSRTDRQIPLVWLR